MTANTLAKALANLMQNAKYEDEDAVADLNRLLEWADEDGGPVLSQGGKTFEEAGYLGSDPGAEFTLEAESGEVTTFQVHVKEVHTRW
jgi:hypothetical protein